MTRRVVLYFWAVVLVCLTPAARGATVSWTNTSGGNWNTASNWSTNTVPASGDDVVIDAAGTYTVNLDTNPTVNTLTIGSATANATLSNTSSRTLTLNGASTVHANGTFTITGGTLTVSSTLTNNGNFNWNGGTVQGAGTVTNNATLTIGGANTHYWTSATLTNNASVVSNTTSYIYLYTSPVFNNAGTWDIQNTEGYYIGSGTPVFNNSGTLKKTTNSGAKDFYLVLNNTGLVDVQTGALRIASGGTSSGDYTVSSGATLAFSGGTHTLGATTDVSGAGAVTMSTGTVTLAGGYNITGGTTLSGGTLSLNGTISNTGVVSLPGGTLNLNAAAAYSFATLNLTGGTLGGSTALTITSAFNWSGGTINRTGSVTIPAASAFNISGNSAKYLYTATLNVAANTTSTATNYIYFYSSPTINNSGVWDMQSDSVYYVASGTPIFNNSGTLKKTTSAGIKEFQLVLNNTGQVDVQTGTLRIAGGGTSSGDYSVASGAALVFYGGTHALDGNVSISGAGSVQAQSGTASLAGDYNITGGTTVNGGTFSLNGTITATGDLTLSSGTFNINTAAYSVNNLTMSNGTLGGSAPLTITTAFNWSGGTVNRTGSITVPAGSAFNISGNTAKYWHTAALHVAANTVSTTTSAVYLYSSPTFNNSGTWDMQSDSPYYLSSGTPVFNNSGTLKKTTSTGTKDFYFILNNTGQVQVQSGTLRLQSGGTSSGDYSVSSGATLVFHGGTFALDSNVSLSGAGAVQATAGTTSLAGDYNITGGTTINGGTLTLNGTVAATGNLVISSGTFNLNTANYTVDNLAISGGTFGGSAGITVTTLFDWTGGTVNRTGAVTVPAGSAFNISGAGGKYWYTATLNVAANTTSTTTSSVYLYNSAVFNNSGTWDMQSDGSYYTGSGTPVFNNSGTLKRTVSSGNKDFYFVLNNTGQVQVQTGNLRLMSGGTSSGDYSVSLGAKLTFYGGTQSLDTNVAITGAGSVEAIGGTATLAGDYNITGGTTVSGGTVTLNGTTTATGVVTISAGALNLNSNYTFATLHLSAGTLGGTGALNITSAFNWSGGTVNRSGSIDVPAGSAFNITGANSKNWYQATLNVAANTVSSGTGWVYLYSNPVFNNSGVWDMQSTGAYYNASTTPVFNNSGTLKKTVSNGIKDFQFALNNTGIVDVQTGMLRLYTGGTSSGDYTISSGALLNFYTGTFTLDNNVSVSGAGAVTMTGSATVTLSGDLNVTGGVTASGGTFSVNGTLTATGPITIDGGTLNLNQAPTYSITTLSLAGGTLGGTGALNITGTFTFAHGTVNRSGAITIPNGATLAFTTTNSHYWYQAALTNAGTVTSSASYWLYVYNGAVFTNQAGATWQLPHGNGLYNAGGATPQFNNSGTVNKDTGIGSCEISLAFNNNGQLNVTAGTVALTNGGTSNGTYTANTGATLRFSGGTHSLSSTAVITGAGTADFQYGTVTDAGGYTVTGPTTITGGTLNLDTTSSVNLASLTITNGILGGNAEINITGTFTFNYGTVNRTGTVNINNGATLDFTTVNAKYWYGATLNNAGTVTAPANFWVYVYNGAVFNNLAGGTWTLPGGNGYYNAGGAMPSFNNAGTVNKTTGATISYFYYTFNNNATLNVTAGTLELMNGGTSSGTYNVTSPAVIRFSGGTHALTNTSSLSGTGAYEFQGGTVTTNGTIPATGTLAVNGGTLEVNTTAPLTLSAPLNITAGTLSGTNNLSLATGSNTWTNGTINRSGSVTVPSGSTFALSTTNAKYLHQTTLNVAGTMTFDGQGWLYMYNGATINVQSGGLFQIQGNNGFYHAAGALPQIINAGTVRKTAGTGVQDVGVAFNNNNLLEVQAATLRLTNGGTGSGAHTVSSGATLRYYGGTHTLDNSASISGAGTVDVGTGTVSLGGAYNVTGATTVTGGTLNLNGTITAIDNLALTSGTLNCNAGTTQTIQSMTISGGTLGGTGNLIVNNLTINSGAVNRSGQVEIPNGGTMTIAGNSSRSWYQATLKNGGTVNTSTFTGSFYFYNGAAVQNLATGVFNLANDGNFWHAGGAVPTFTNNGTLSKSAGTATSHFVFNTTNNGIVDLQTGILSFSNGYTQTASGTTKISLGGTTAGTQYARAAVTGAANLTGALQILLTGGFTPSLGDTFQIMTMGSRSGDFATKSGLTYGGGSLNYAANATNLTLSTASATADLSITKTASAGTVPTGSSFTYTLQVANAGPSGGTNVRVTDTLPSGVTFTSHTGTGWTCASDGGTPPTITCTMASLAVGSANAIVLTVSAPLAAQTIINTAAVTSDVGDPTSSNDSASASVNVVTPTPGVTVTSNADSGANTLRQAIIDANTGVCSSPCTIAFNLSPVTPIALTTGDLPAINTNLTIDGTTQAGYSGTPIIELDGSSCGTCTNGFAFNTTGATVRGVVVKGFSGAGVKFSTGSSGNTLELSTIGTSGAPNAGGVLAQGPSLIRDNTIAFNTGDGVAVIGTSGVRILGNAIHDHGDLAIDHGGDGANAIDTGDSDAGDNGKQNAPVISSADASTGMLDVVFSVDSSSVGGTGSMRVEIFEADAGGEAKEYLGGGCFAGNTLTSQTLSLSAPNITTGDSIVATATSYSGTGCVTVNDGTSEMSASFAVVTCTPPSANITAPSAVCASSTGNTASVPFVAGATYTWTITNGTITSGATTNSITFTANASGVVELQATVNDNGCTTNGTANITINAPTTPTINAEGATTFCAGGSVTLTASSGAAYLWSNGANTQSITVNASGSYSVTVTDASGCSASSAPTIVTVNPAPVVNITGPTAMCAGATVTLNAGSGFASYLWSTGETSQSINVSPASSTSYTVTVVDANGCSANASHTVTVDSNPSAAITASGPTTFCSGQSVTLTAGTANSYQWYRDNVLLGTETSASILVTVAGSYTVEVTNAGGCTATSSPTIVTVNNATTPTISAGGATTFCAPGSVALTASAGASYVWSVDNNVISGATAQTYNATASGNYTVTVTDANGCSATSAPTPVIVYPAATVTITGPTATCPNGSVTLDAGPGFSTYNWSTGDTTRTITVTPSVDTTYTVSVTDANACPASDSHTVTISANPAAVISAPASTCASSTANNASVAAQPGATYVWTITNGTITSGAGTNAIQFTAGTNGYVDLGVTVTIGSCVSTGNASVLINTPPTVTITGDANACANATVQLDAGPGFASYNWSTGDTTQVINVSPSSSTSYTVLVTDANACSATASHTVNVYTPPVVTITGPTSTCTSSPVTLDAGAGFASYNWSTGETTQTITVSPAANTTYTVNVIDTNGCTATDSHTVTVSAAPTTSITVAGSVCASSSAHTASVAAVPGASYLWTITGGTIDAGQGTDAITWSAGPSGTVQLDVAVTTSGCTSNGSAQVTITTPPSIAISGPTTSCAAAPITLDAGPGFASYNWSTGAQTQTITVSPTSTTTYTVNVTDNSACTATDSHLVTVTAAPTVNITGPTTACTNTTITLDAGPGFTSYNWSTGETTQTIYPSYSSNPSSTSYTVTVTDTNGCTATDTHTVTVTPTPDATITAPATITAADPGTASVPAQPGATYAWTITNGGFTSATTGNSVNFDAGTSGTLTLNVTVTLNGCTATSTHNITITQQQTVDVSVVKSGPVEIATNANFSWTISLANNSTTGTNVTVTDTLPAGVAIQSVTTPNLACNAGAGEIVCTGFLAASSLETIIINAAAPQTAGAITNHVSVATSLGDHAPSNNAASATTNVTAPAPVCETVPPSLLTPANNATSTSPVTFTWTSVSNAAAYELWMTTNGITSLKATTSNTSATAAVESGAHTWFVIARQPSGCEALVSASRVVNVEAANNCDQHLAPQVIAPAQGASLTSPVTFSWTAVPQAIGYRVWIRVDGAGAQDIGTTDGALTLNANVPAGAIEVFVDALFGGCPSTRSASITFNVTEPDPCASRSSATPLTPANNATLDSSHVTFTWSAATGAASYRVWASINGAAAAVLGTTTSTSFNAKIDSGEGIWWIESLYPGCASTESPRFRFVIPERTNCSTERPTIVSPANNTVVTNANVTFVWNAVAGAIGYEVWLGTANGTASLIGSTDANVTSLTRTVPAGALQWTVIALVDRCPSRESQKAGFTYTPPAACENNQRPVALAPLDAVSSTSPVDFAWSAPAGATRYELYVSRNNAAPVLVANVTTNEANDIALATGGIQWFVRAFFGSGCSSLDSAEQDLTVVPTPAACGNLNAPVISAPGEISSGVPFLVQWSPIAGATAYQLQIASDSDFDNAENLTLSGTSHTIERTNNGSAPLAVFARVRAIDSRCTPVPAVSLYGPTSAIFILPAATSNGTVPLGGTDTTVQYTITLGSEFAGQTFTAIPTQPWLSVSPASGVVANGGTILTVTANTTALGVGANTGSINVSLSGPTISSNATSVILPISVNLVTPVAPTTKDTPPPDAMIIPAVASAAGINAQFQSDVRVSNTSTQLIKYQLSFVPSGEAGMADGKQTTFSVEPGRTVALDDILKTWFGAGTENTVGSLEIRPLTQTSTSTSSEALGALANIVSFASSRTFNATSNGTFGQYIPAVPFANFLGKNAEDALSDVLSLQQISQSAKFRTNVGFVEGSGERVDLLVSVFGSNGGFLGSFPVSLNGGQHTQLNLRNEGFEVEDGRVEVQIVGGGGKITAYASVLDNATADAILVTPVTLSQNGNTKWVIPGVADVATGFANWKSDMRVFNAGTEPVNITASFYSQNGGEPKVNTLTIDPGQVKQLDKVLATLFNAAGDGGAVHLETAKPERLIATARTYNETSTGSYGLFASAVTPAEAVGVGSRPLQLLQVEESTRFRSNIGFAEVTGKPVTLEVTIIPPDAKFSATIEVPLNANEFRQIGGMLQSLGIGDTYNARISVRAISGEGRATAYAAVIDMKTNDPTYVPAQ